MEELFLRGFLAADELDIVDHQHVDRTELVLERHRVPEAQGTDELVHELLGGHVQHAALRMVLPQVPGDGRSEEHTSELPSLMRISYAVFCFKIKINTYTLPHLSLSVT